ncbi:MAG: outer membrane protein assembly factor BamE [Burkholderiaceae bacterium]|nr:outer membrane protein assembly factor BamE [Ideonella sp.]MCC7288608.1 outer membrane protein assembly factor BamE [Burkholderiaceae bacterium]
MPGRLPSRLRIHRPALWAAGLTIALGGCSAISPDGSLLGLVTPYRIDIVQGNVVTKEQLAMVRPGMSRVQVRDLLGSPLLTDPFHADRWDYVFTIARPGTAPQRRDVIVLFEGDHLKKIDAPELPSEREFVASISRTSASGKKVELELTPEQMAALPAPPKTAAPPPEPAMGPLRTYPPLEPN